jgi:hypothetical protein
LVFSDPPHTIIIQQHLSPCKVFKGEFAKFFQHDWRASFFSHLEQGLEECRNPTSKEREDDIHTPEMGTWESSETFKNLELNCRGQNTLPWTVLYTVGNVLKRRCLKWPLMGHSDICSTSYVWKKGQESNCRESNWQFDSRPLKGWFPSFQETCDIPLESSQRGLQLCFRPHCNRRSTQEVMHPQSCGTPSCCNFGTPSGTPGTKSHLDVAPVKWRRIYYMGEGGGFPRVWAVVSFVSPKSPMVRPSTKGAPESELTNSWLVGCRSE